VSLLPDNENDIKNVESLWDLIDSDAIAPGPSFERSRLIRFEQVTPAASEKTQNSEKAQASAEALLPQSDTASPQQPVSPPLKKR